MIIFLDCEYTDAIQCDLISIGMVSEDGQYSFYAERNDYEHAWCNSFLQHCILSLLDASNVVTREELTAQLRAWFATLPRQVVIACDDHTDWDLFLDAFDGELPANVDRPFKNLRYLIDTTVYNEAVCCYHDQPNQPWHHSLHDAKAHRSGWLAWADADKIKKGNPHD